jgi:hypothetical protein
MKGAKQMDFMNISAILFSVFFIGIYLWYLTSKPKEEKQLLTKLIEFSNNGKVISVKELLLGFSRSSKHNLTEVFDCCENFNNALLTDEVFISLYYNDVENLQWALKLKKPVGKICISKKTGENDNQSTDSMCVEEKIGYSILHGEVKINELCFAERTGNKSFYIYSFRYCRDCKNEEEYQQTLELLQSDINRLPNGRLRTNLEEVYDSYSDYEYCLKCKMM